MIWSYTYIYIYIYWLKYTPIIVPHPKMDLCWPIQKKDEFSVLTHPNPFKKRGGVSYHFPPPPPTPTTDIWNLQKSCDYATSRAGVCRWFQPVFFPQRELEGLNDGFLKNSKLAQYWGCVHTTKMPDNSYHTVFFFRVHIFGSLKQKAP